MEVHQVRETAKIILKHYWHLNPADFKLCFDFAKAGFYGTTYNRIDGDVICTWLNGYDVERGYAAFDLQQNKILDERKESEKVVGDLIADPRLKAKQKEAAEKKRASLPARELTPAEKTTQEHYTEFDRIWLEQGGDISTAIRFVLIEGVKMDQNDFVKNKLKTK